MNSVLRLGALAACAGLAACAAAGPTIYGESNPRTKIDAFYDDGAGDRDLKLVVFGDPFPMPPDAFARTVEADLRGAPSMHQPTRPLLAPGESAKPIYRLVYVFNPASGMFGNAICRRGLKAEANEDFPPASTPSAAMPGQVVAVAAFCVEYRAVSEVSGQTAATGPDDVRVYQLTREMMSQLFRPDVHWDTNGQQRPAT
jgi:hypothetical protein